MPTQALPDPRRLVDDIVIEHTAFHVMLERMKGLWRDAQAHIPIVAPFIGETGTGKSTVIRAFLNEHPPRRSPDGLEVPVLCVQVPANPTPLSLGEELLRALGDPRPNAGSAANKLARIVKMLVCMGVLVVVLDDMQHFIDKRQHIALFAASDYLKTCLIMHDVVLICVGLPETRLVIRSNEQLRTRSQAAFELPRFDWQNRVSQNGFVGVLNSFQSALKDYELPKLTSPDVSIRMYLATGGLIRYVSRILSRSVRNAIDARTTVIRLEDLEAAWLEEVDGANDEFEDPFPSSFKLTDLPTKIAGAKKIGQRVDRPEPIGHRGTSSLLNEVGL